MLTTCEEIYTSFLHLSVIKACLNNGNMMILLCELVIKPERNSFSTTLVNKITSKLLSFLIISFFTEKLNISCSDTSSGPVFSTGAMGQIPITLRSLPCITSTPTLTSKLKLLK